MSTARFVLTPRGEFSLAKAIRFVHGFEPLSRDGEGGDPDETLRLAFCADGDWRPVAVRARRSGSGRIAATPSASRTRSRSDGRSSACCRSTSTPRPCRTPSPTTPSRPGSCGASAACDRSASPRRTRRRAGRSSASASRCAKPRASGAGCATSWATPSSSTGSGSRRSPPRSGSSTPRRSTGSRRSRSSACTRSRRRRSTAGSTRDAARGRTGAGARRPAAPAGDRPVRRGARAHPRWAGEPDHFARSERRLHAAMAEAYGVDAGDIDALEAIARAGARFAAGSASCSARARRIGEHMTARPHRAAAPGGSIG